MKAINVAFGFILLTAVSMSHAAPVTLAEMQAIQVRANSGSFAGRAEWNALAFYLQGVIEGAAGYKEGLGERGKALLFCPPKQAAFSLEEFITILNRVPESEKSRPVSTVLFEAYTEKYPC